MTGSPQPDFANTPGGVGTLVARDRCPLCDLGGVPFLSEPYDDGPIAAYLDEKYGGSLDRRPLEGATYELIDCGGCGLVYQRHAPDSTYLAHLYGVAARHDVEAENRSRGLAVRRSYSQDVEQAIKYLGGEPHGVEVLDFGSGPCMWLDMAAAYGCRTAGSELSDEGVRWLATRGHEAIAPEDLPEERFDFVNTQQVVEHLTEPLGAVRRLAASLRPGGLLRISVPNGSPIRELLADPDWSAAKGSPRSLNAVAPLEHVNCFTPASLGRLGEAAGLEPFHYPMRQYFDTWERARFIVSAAVHRIRRPTGTLQLFHKPSRR